MSEAGSVAQAPTELLEEPIKKAPDTPAFATPGRTGRVNFPLHDSVLRLPVLDKVKEAKKATLESKPDILGLRGPVWNESVALQPGKHQPHYSGAVLSNTLSPQLINAKDVRKLAGSTACRADPDAATLDRSRSPSHQLGGWNTSTVVPGPLDKQRQLDAVTSTSLAATRGRSPPVAEYMDPVSRQTAYSEAVRSIKANSGTDMQDLYDRYGVEGGEAMAAILRMPSRESRPRIRATRADLEAVRALDDFAPGQEKEEEPGEAVPLGPSSGSM